MDPHVEWTPEFWLFGFLSTVFTNDWYFGPALIHLFEYVINLWPLHKTDAASGDDCTMLLYHAGPVNGIATWCGVFTGLAFVYVTKFPKVLDPRFSFAEVSRSIKLLGHVKLTLTSDKYAANGDSGVPWNPKMYIWTLLGLVVPFALIFTSILLLLGYYVLPTTISQSTSNILGGIFLALGIIVLIIYTWAVFKGYANVPDSHDKSGQLQAKYFLLFLLAMATPAVMDHLTPEIGHWGAFSLHMLAALIIYLIIFWTSGYDRYFSGRSNWTRFGIFALLFFIHLTIYIGGPVELSYTVPTLNGILVWVSAFSAAWIVILLIASLIVKVDYTLINTKVRSYVQKLKVK